MARRARVKRKSAPGGCSAVNAVNVKGRVSVEGSIKGRSGRTYRDCAEGKFLWRKNRRKWLPPYRAGRNAGSATVTYPCRQRSHRCIRRIP